MYLVESQRNVKAAPPRRPESLPGPARRVIRCRLSNKQTQGLIKISAELGWPTIYPGPVLRLELVRVIACYLKRAQTIPNSTHEMMAIPARKALCQFNSRITDNSAGPGVCFPCKIDSRSSSFVATRSANFSAKSTYPVGWLTLSVLPTGCVTAFPV